MGKDVDAGAVAQMLEPIQLFRVHMITFGSNGPDHGTYSRDAAGACRQAC